MIHIASECEVDILILMCTVKCVTLTEPILGYRSADQGRALDDVRATRDCPLKCPSLDGYRVFIRIVLVDGRPGFK